MAGNTFGGGGLALDRRQPESRAVGALPTMGHEGCHHEGKENAISWTGYEQRQLGPWRRGGC